MKHEPYILVTSELQLSLLKLWPHEAKEGDKQENLTLKCWTNGHIQVDLYVVAVTAACPPHGTMQLHHIAAACLGMQPINVLHLSHVKSRDLFFDLNSRIKI
jgi:hypothetical protein